MGYHKSALYRQIYSIGLSCSPYLILLVDSVSAQYAVLHQEALLHISGPDSLAFLQGQTTCDTRTVGPRQATIGAYCTPKGRVVCDFLLCQIAADRFALRMRADILEASAATFGKYIVFSKADIDLENTYWQAYACWGHGASSALCSALEIANSLASTAPKYACVAGDGFVVVQTDDTATAFECYIDTQTHPELASKLAQAMPEVEESAWQVLQIDRGIARIEAATVETFVPQALNYDLTGHISFDKGCYTGQEVVARLHYRGTPKKRLCKATATLSSTPPAGATLYDAESDKSAGTLVNVAIGPDEQAVALIVAPVSEEPTSFRLLDPKGPIFTVSSTG